ncbi:MAG: hypothetical protein ACT4QC_08900 [Planctomycetaceae bacterium]
MSNLFAMAGPDLLDRLGWSLLHSLWQGTLVALCLVVALRLLRHCSANLRYLVCCGALALVLIWPAVTLCRMTATDWAPHDQVVPVDDAEASGQLGPTIELPTAIAGEGGAEAPAAVAGRPPAFEVAPVSERGDRLFQRLALLLQTYTPLTARLWLAGVLMLSRWHIAGWLRVEHLARRRAVAAASWSRFAIRSRSCSGT